MSRGLTSEVQAAFAANSVAPVLFINLEFKSGWIYLWTGVGSIVWNGNTYLGIMLPNGALIAAISDLTETTELSAQSMSLTLPGVPAALVQQVLAECLPGLGARIFIGARNLGTDAILPDPFCAWGGYTDIPVISDDGQTATVSITVESRLVDLQRSTQWRYTHQDQQLFSPGDLGFTFVGALQTVGITWGTGRDAGPAAIAPVPSDSGYRGVGP